LLFVGVGGGGGWASRCGGGWASRYGGGGGLLLMWVVVVLVVGLAVVVVLVVVLVVAVWVETEGRRGVIRPKKTLKKCTSSPAYKGAGYARQPKRVHKDVRHRVGAEEKPVQDPTRKPEHNRFGVDGCRHHLQ